MSNFNNIVRGAYVSCGYEKYLPTQKKPLEAVELADNCYSLFELVDEAIKEMEDFIRRIDKINGSKLKERLKDWQSEQIRNES